MEPDQVTAGEEKLLHDCDGQHLARGRLFQHERAQTRLRHGAPARYAQLAVRGEEVEIDTTQVGLEALFAAYRTRFPPFEGERTAALAARDVQTTIGQGNLLCYRPSDSSRS